MKQIKIYKENPHYFEFRKKSCILITSGEHYGALINPDFNNYVKYFDELKRHNFNITRVFSGSYREDNGDFGIVYNNLAPAHID